MLEELDFMVRFWQLRARHAALGKPLTSPEHVQLVALRRALSAAHAHAPPGLPSQVDHGIPIQLSFTGGFASGLITQICAEGVVVTCSAPMRVDESTVVRIADAVSGLEYTLPCVVERVLSTTPWTLQLRLAGDPARAHFATLPDPSAYRAATSTPQASPWLPK